jgi:feruloyl esterase
MVSQIGWLSGSVPNDPQHNIYMSLEEWVEKGIAPKELIATKYEGEGLARHPTMTRPLCAFPQTSKYKGTGDTSNAANFVCTVAAK